ncbi:recombination protein RecA [Nitzschia inconspicua]|uniref:Recombination protein RecA n=1 Tax=Nitzschia inconspicua TaxID=303405 RepID=A0A9K3K537_9STRA|nr:recombination protein RecA [Nitzschia inconspicua]
MKPFFLERAVVVSSVVLSSSSAFQLRQSFHRRHDNLASPSISGGILEAKKKVVEDGDGVDLSSKLSSMDPAKRAALDGVLNQIERSYGRGRVIEIYGPESSGKTTLALHAIAECQKAGGIAAFVDAEHALDPVYAAGLGVGVDDLLVSQPDSGEMALDIVDQLVRSSAVDVIVVDSVAALVPRAELEGDMSDSQIGLQARLMSKAMRKITGSLSLSQCTVIFLNQLRSKVGVIYGSPEVTSGGNALKFYASVRLDTRRKEILPDNKGIRVKVKVVKNKVAAPFKAVMLDIIFGTGIDSWGCTLDAALDLGIVERRGSWYAYQGNQLAQGRHNVVEYLKTNDLGESIKEDVRQALANYGQPVDLDDDGDVDMPDADIDLEISNSSEELRTGFE